MFEMSDAWSGCFSIWHFQGPKSELSPHSTPAPPPFIAYFLILSKPSPQSNDTSAEIDPVSTSRSSSTHRSNRRTWEIDFFRLLKIYHEWMHFHPRTDRQICCAYGAFNTIDTIAETAESSGTVCAGNVYKWGRLDDVLIFLSRRSRSRFLQDSRTSCACEESSGCVEGVDATGGNQNAQPGDGRRIMLRSFVISRHLNWWFSHRTRLESDNCGSSASFLSR